MLLSELQFITTARGKKTLLLNGHSYNQIWSKDSKMVLWTCVKKRSLLCKVAIRTAQNTVLSITGTHNHKPPKNNIFKSATNKPKNVLLSFQYEWHYNTQRKLSIRFSSVKLCEVKMTYTLHQGCVNLYVYIFYFYYFIIVEHICIFMEKLNFITKTYDY